MFFLYFFLVKHKSWCCVHKQQIEGLSRVKQTPGAFLGQLYGKAHGDVCWADVHTGAVWDWVLQTFLVGMPQILSSV